MGSIYTQMLPKALAAGASAQTPNSEGERHRRFPVWQAEGRQFPSSPRAPDTLGTPLKLRKYSILNVFANRQSSSIYIIVVYSIEHL